MPIEEGFKSWFKWDGFIYVENSVYMLRKMKIQRKDKKNAHRKIREKPLFGYRHVSIPFPRSLSSSKSAKKKLRENRCVCIWERERERASSHATIPLLFQLYFFCSPRFFFLSASNGQLFFWGVSAYKFWRISCCLLFPSFFHRNVEKNASQPARVVVAHSRRATAFEIQLFFLSLSFFFREFFLHSPAWRGNIGSDNGLSFICYAHLNGL